MSAALSIYTAKLVAGGFAVTEGPRWHHGRLYFADMHGHAVYEVEGDRSPKRIAEIDSPAGIGWLPDGRMLVAAQRERKVMRLDPQGPVIHADLSRLVDSAINDMWVDTDGRAYVGEMGFDIHGFIRQDPAVAPREARLFLIQPDSGVSVATGNVFFPNGIVIGRDGRLLVAESFGFRITAFDLNSDGSLTNRRLWAQLTFAPDGIDADRDGFLWISDPAGKRTVRVAEGGEVTAVVASDRSSLACALGGADMRSLYICTTANTDPIEAPRLKSSRIEVATVDVPGVERAGKS